MTVLAAIGDIARFPTPKYLVSYAGLAPGVEQSGTKKRSKTITKEGRKELRWALVEVAWRAVRSDPLWKRRFDEQRRGLTRQQFARYYLMRLGIGGELRKIALDPKHPHRLASVAELPALFPELAEQVMRLTRFLAARLVAYRPEVGVFCQLGKIRANSGFGKARRVASGYGRVVSDAP